jgi:hypothetical protein
MNMVNKINAEKYPLIKRPIAGIFQNNANIDKI